MKLTEQPTKKNKVGDAPHYRRLRFDELVSKGDFVGDSQRGFELWEGPNGFRADAFVQPTYRREGTPSGLTKKSK